MKKDFLVPIIGFLLFISGMISNFLIWSSPEGNSDIYQITIGIAVSAGIGLTIPNMISASMPHDNAKTPEENHSPDSTETGGVMVGKGLRTKDNTNCVNPPGGPMIC